MNVLLTLDTKYVDILQALGSLEDSVETAVRYYAIEKTGERIGQLQREIWHGSKWGQITLTNFCAPMTHTYSQFIAVTALNG